jgi:serine/threonine protein kinase
MRFFQEIEITRALRHENLVRLIKAGYHQNTFYLALEYCDRGSVAQLIEDRNAPLRIDEAVEITRQALDGLHYAHSQFRIGKPLIHRDIKPANILLAGSGGKLVARIADYGLAKALDDSGLSGLTRTGDRAGTPIFMPRQQVLHFKHPTTDFDVWAMAASLYYMLTMSPPRTFSKQKDRWTTVLEADPVPIRIRRADLPRRLADAIDHALTERPAIGFKTAAEFKDALDGTA